MFQKPRVPDRQILQKVSVQLPARGIRPPCNVRVSVHNGTVTLSGKLEFELQRKAAIHAASSVNGVQRVVDEMAVMRSTIGGWHAKATPKYTPRVTAPRPAAPPEATTAESPQADAQREESSSPPGKGDS